MDHHIDIAWALEIPHAQLGARLEAYIETKPTITAFRACLRQLRLPPKAEIPQENLADDSERFERCYLRAENFDVGSRSKMCTR